MLLHNYLKVRQSRLFTITNLFLYVLQLDGVDIVEVGVPDPAVLLGPQLPLLVVGVDGLDHPGLGVVVLDEDGVVALGHLQAAHRQEVVGRPGRATVLRAPVLPLGLGRLHLDLEPDRPARG